MWRYYLIATVLVVAVGSFAFALHLRRAAAPNAAPMHEQAPVAGHAAAGLAGGGAARPPRAFVGEGGWVLSALPDCFDQKSVIEGAALALTFDVPPARERLAPGTVLHRGPCTVHVRGDDVWVERGVDRLRVPPSARLYTTPTGLVLVYKHAGRTEIRRY
ncbi:MAG: hypothetical protein ABSD03_10060 [Vulcanimicrobiaceae bacterium]|jgi:hypothetical protein